MLFPLNYHDLTTSKPQRKLKRSSIGQHWRIQLKTQASWRCLCKGCKSGLRKKLTVSCNKIIAVCNLKEKACHWANRKSHNLEMTLLQSQCFGTNRSFPSACFPRFSLLHFPLERKGQSSTVWLCLVLAPRPAPTNGKRHLTWDSEPESVSGFSQLYQHNKRYHPIKLTFFNSHWSL